MSVSSLQNSVQRYQREVADLQKKISEETKNEAAKHARIVSVQGSITSSTSPSTRTSKNQEITRLTSELGGIQGKKADLTRRLGSSTTQLHKAETNLAKELENERKKVREAEDKRHKEQLERGKTLARQLEERNRLAAQAEVPPRPRVAVQAEPVKRYDVFVSHATEDKDEFVRPLAHALEERDCSVWFDESTLKIGDSLRRSIDRALANSRYGVVVLSSSFFAKAWPQYELDGLVTREMSG